MPNKTEYSKLHWVQSSAGRSYAARFEPLWAFSHTVITNSLLQSGLFGVLFSMAKDTTSSRLTMLVLMLLDWLQMLSFPLSRVQSFAWA